MGWAYLKTTNHFVSSKISNEEDSCDVTPSTISQAQDKTQKVRQEKYLPEHIKQMYDFKRKVCVDQLEEAKSRIGSSR